MDDDVDVDVGMIKIWFQGVEEVPNLLFGEVQLVDLGGLFVVEDQLPSARSCSSVDDHSVIG